VACSLVYSKGAARREARAGTRGRAPRGGGWRAGCRFPAPAAHGVRDAHRLQSGNRTPPHSIFLKRGNTSFHCIFIQGSAISRERILTPPFGAASNPALVPSPAPRQAGVLFQWKGGRGCWAVATTDACPRPRPVGHRSLHGGVRGSDLSASCGLILKVYECMISCHPASSNSSALHLP